MRLSIPTETGEEFILWDLSKGLWFGSTTLIGNTPASFDAHSLGIKEGAKIEVTSAVGSLSIRSRISDRVAPGVVCSQHGWGSRVFSSADKEEPLCFGVNVNQLVDNAAIDPFSGIPNLNSTRVKVTVCADT